MGKRCWGNADGETLMGNADGETLRRNECKGAKVKISMNRFIKSPPPRKPEDTPMKMTLGSNTN